jgi:DNA-binding transcriptional ArsR family regulator
MTSIHWTSGSACDFFISLFALHHAADFGLRPTWTAGVRQRLTARSRETLDKVFSFSSVPLVWISLLPAPQDAQIALQTLAALAPADRIPVLTLPGDFLSRAQPLLNAIAARGTWSAEERTRIVTLYEQGPRPSSIGYDNLLDAWTALAEMGERYLEALKEYYQAFFLEEEIRIRPALEHGLSEAQSLRQSLPSGELIDRLSRGVRLENLEEIDDLTLLPSWWITPLAYLARPVRGTVFMAFGVRPEPLAGAEAAEAPGMLVNTLKSLGDPTRLRILRYLSRGPLSPSELARRLRLRPPTVIHHLRLLRFAGLVHVTVSENLERRYTARPEALKLIFTSLQDYLDSNV